MILCVYRYFLLTKQWICISNVFCNYSQYTIWTGRNGRFSGDFQVFSVKLIWGGVPGTVTEHISHCAEGTLFSLSHSGNPVGSASRVLL